VRVPAEFGCTVNAKDPDPLPGPGFVMVIHEGTETGVQSQSGPIVVTAMVALPPPMPKLPPDALIDSTHAGFGEHSTLGAHEAVDM
jgi:hypothetical protein